MNKSQLETFLLTWIRTQTGFAQGKVISADQEKAFPELPYIRMQFKDYEKVGLMDEKEQKKDGKIKLWKIRRINIDINGFGPGTKQAIENLYDSLEKPSVYKSFRSNDITINPDKVKNLSGKENDKVIERALLELELKFSNYIVDDLGSFNKILVTPIINDITYPEQTIQI